jgi:hypothetical protein
MEFVKLCSHNFSTHWQITVSPGWSISWLPFLYPCGLGVPARATTPRSSQGKIQLHTGNLCVCVFFSTYHKQGSLILPVLKGSVRASEMQILWNRARWWRCCPRNGLTQNWDSYSLGGGVFALGDSSYLQWPWFLVFVQVYYNLLSLPSISFILFGSTCQSNFPITRFQGTRL